MRRFKILLGILVSLSCYGQIPEELLSPQAERLYCHALNDANYTPDFYISRIESSNHFSTIEKFILINHLAKTSIKESGFISESILRVYGDLDTEHVEKFHPQFFNEYLIIRSQNAINTGFPNVALTLLNKIRLLYPAFHSYPNEYLAYKMQELRAAAYFRMGEFQKAELLAHTVCEYLDSTPSLAEFIPSAYLNYATTLSGNGKYQEAALLFRDLEDRLKKHPSITGNIQLTFRYNQINNYFQWGQIEQAEELIPPFFNKVRELNSDTNHFLGLLLNLYLSRDQYNEAESLYNQYLSPSSSGKEAVNRSSLNLSIALAKIAEGKHDMEGFHEIVSALEVEQDRLSMAEGLEVKFLKIRSDYYYFLNSGNCDLLPDIQKSLIEVIECFTQKKSSLRNPKDIEIISNLSEPVRTMFFEIIKMSEDKCGISSTLPLFWAMEVYKQQESKHSSNKNSHEYSVPTQFHTGEVQKILNKLKQTLPSEEHVLLYMYNANSVSYIFILSKKESRLVRIPNSKEIIENNNSLLTSLANFKLETYLENDYLVMNEREIFQNSGFKLYKSLISPLQINHYKHWHISPDIGLESIPYDLLTTNPIPNHVSWSELNYLIKNVSINFFESADQLLQKSVKNPTSNDILSITDKHSMRLEASSSKALSGKEADFFVSRFKVSERYNSDYVDKEAFWQEALHYRYIHFALHGHTAQHEEPSLDFINFNLTSTDISGRNLNSEMVVLGTCNSAAGAKYKGFRKESLMQAFRRAGVRNIIAMRWEAEDESTAVVLERFYYYLSEGWDKSNAMRRAKLDFITEAGQRKSHPFFWATSEVYGDFESIEFEESAIRKVRMWVFFGLPILLIGLLLGIKKRVTSTFDMTRPNKL